MPLWRRRPWFAVAIEAEVTNLGDSPLRFTRSRSALCPVSGRGLCRRAGGEVVKARELRRHGGAAEQVGE